MFPSASIAARFTRFSLPSPVSPLLFHPLPTPNTTLPAPMATVEYNDLPLVAALSKLPPTDPGSACCVAILHIYIEWAVTMQSSHCPEPLLYKLVKQVHNYTGLAAPDFHPEKVGLCQLTHGAGESNRKWDDAFLGGAGSPGGGWDQLRQCRS